MQWVIAFPELLEAMDGVVLVLDPDLVIRHLGWRNWNSFWKKNGGVKPLEVVGRDIAMFFSPGEVRATYRKIFSEVATRKRGDFLLDYRCDSPTLKRSMWPVPGLEDTELGVFMEPEVGVRKLSEWSLWKPSRSVMGSPHIANRL